VVALSLSSTKSSLVIDTMCKQVLSVRDQLVLYAALNHQVVFTGPTVAAEAHFTALGHAPQSPGQSVADHVLDLVIKVGVRCVR
jgi:hypothetical protein